MKKILIVTLLFLMAGLIFAQNFSNTHYRLPQNVRVVFAGMENVTIKIGNDYYSSRMEGREHYFWRYNNGTWQNYTKAALTGNRWLTQGSQTDERRMLTRAIGAVNLFNNMNYDYTKKNLVTVGNSTVAGVPVVIKYFENIPGMAESRWTLYINEETGLVFKMEGTINFEVIEWDTSVTSFAGIDIP